LVEGFIYWKEGPDNLRENYDFDICHKQVVVDLAISFLGYLNFVKTAHVDY